jgi:hypothetical protein
VKLWAKVGPVASFSGADESFVRVFTLVRIKYTNGLPIMSGRLKNILIIALALIGATFAGAQQRANLAWTAYLDLPSPIPEGHAALPRVAPALALQLFLGQKQSTNNLDYSSQTVVHAELPELEQTGDYELVRVYSAQPRSLKYAPVRFTGNGFVKSNVILRVLQSEVDRIEKDDPAELAISERNYKFSYKGVQTLNGGPVHVFHVKPRHRHQGLFKGRICLDASSGHLRRAEGTPVKSPSFFIKRAEFVQDFGDFGQYTLPTRLHSTAETRLIGRALLDIVYSSYQFSSAKPRNEAVAGQSF